MSTDVGHSFVTQTVRPLLHPPADVVVGVGITVVSALVVLFTDSGLQMVLALPLLLFLPGYAIVSALLPAVGRTAPGLSPVASVRREAGREQVALGLGERVALSFGLSLALLPPLGLALFVSGAHISETTVVESLASLTVLGLLVASYRRWDLPEHERFRVPFGEWADDAWASVFGTDSPVDGVLNVALALAVVLALSALVYGVTMTDTDASYTDFSVLTQDASGELVASGYPSEFVVGQTESVVLSVTNEEGATTSYTVVVELHRVNDDGVVLERAELTRTSATLADGETWRPTVALTPQLVGEDLRVTFYLYEGSGPVDTSTDTASDPLYFWVDVRAG